MHALLQYYSLFTKYKLTQEFACLGDSSVTMQISEVNEPKFRAFSKLIVPFYQYCVCNFCHSIVWILGKNIRQQVQIM